MHVKIVLLLSVFLVKFAFSREFESLNQIKPKVSAEDQQSAVTDLIRRAIGDRVSDFRIIVAPEYKTEGKDTFSILSLKNGKIQITGTTGVVAATGFNYYLKYYCNCHISWQITQLNLPDTWPEANITVPLNDKFRYYQNVCTTSYSFVWWNWEQWERHIDWMALNSFNLVLAFNGQEAIWQRVYRKLSLTQEDIDDHFSGPAFLAWLRMGNMRGWGGPLSDAWHTKSLELQKQILNRMRQLGIIPVLPAFAGHLPRAFKRLYPNVKMLKMETWNDFQDQYCCPYFLDPTEPLFNVIGTMFMREQIQEYGTDHVYNCDSFNENKPTSGNLTYLDNVGKSTYKAMTDVDPDAVWVMQNWLFVHDSLFWSIERAKTLLMSVPIGKMIVLDLQSEEFPKYDELDQYFGQPYIWCMLHNFGGTLGMLGSSDIINERPIEARNMEGSTMIGTGLTPEGINQNYVIYDLMMENAWTTKKNDLQDWFKKYSERRYGKSNEYTIHAWQILQKSVYNFKELYRIHGKYIVVSKPTLRLIPKVWYNTSEVVEAWELFLKAVDDLKDSSGYLHDLTDLTRQILQNHADVYYRNMVRAFRQKDHDLFRDESNKFIQVQDDLEEILASNEHFLLGTWLESAKSLASSSEEEEQFEFNARNQITLWGPRGEIDDYAIKQWSGVIKNFTHPRWTVFISYLDDLLKTNGTFNQTEISDIIFNTVEEPFSEDRSVFPTVPIGNTIEIAEKIHNRSWIIKDWRHIDRMHRRLFTRRHFRDPSFLSRWLSSVE